MVQTVTAPRPDTKVEDEALLPAIGEAVRALESGSIPATLSDPTAEFKVDVQSTLDRLSRYLENPDSIRLPSARARLADEIAGIASYLESDERQGTSEAPARKLDGTIQKILASGDPKIKELLSCSEAISKELSRIERKEQRGSAFSEKEVDKIADLYVEMERTGYAATLSSEDKLRLQAIYHARELLAEDMAENRRLFGATDKTSDRAEILNDLRYKLAAASDTGLSIEALARGVERDIHQANGHAPGLAHLNRLVQLYEADVPLQKSWAELDRVSYLATRELCSETSSEVASHQKKRSYVRARTESIERDVERTEEAALATFTSNYLETHLGPERAARFIQMQQEGKAEIVTLTPGEIHEMQEREKIVWREPVIEKGTLAQSQMPMDPVELGSKPPTFIARDGESAEDPRYVLLNGNRRVFKTAFDNPECHAMQAVFYHSQEAYNYVHGGAVDLRPQRSYVADGTGNIGAFTAAETTRPRLESNPDYARKRAAERKAA